MESLISDLALILVVGAVVTWVFKKLGQPLVLGYIVAGFLASPHFSYMPTVAHEDNIEFWAQLGIVVLLFSLGLEFSFNKLRNVGGSAMATAFIIITGMMGLGFLVGRLSGMGTVDSLFLGGVLSMSSTTIIIKAFDDLNMRHRRFAPVVLAVLVCEDLFAVVLMVLLSSVAIKQRVDSSEILMSVAKLALFIIILFIVGIVALPTFLRKNRRFLSDEMLLVLSMGICFCTAAAAYYSGFSLALGAFASGSVLAGTVLAERIERVVEPVKNLFGAVFFISVGMMVNPTMIVKYADSIAILSVVVIVGMITFGTLGMLIMGQPLKIAMESGFSLTQIGEFSFIIVSMGTSFGVLDEVVYPIVVAVSVITTFFTPYFIKASVPCYNWVERHLPERMKFLLNDYSKREREMSDYSKLWRAVLARYAWRVLLYSCLLTFILIASSWWLSPLIINYFGETYGTHIVVALTLLAMSPFLIALATPSINEKDRQKIKDEGSRYSFVPLAVMRVFRFIILSVFVVLVFSSYYSLAIIACVVVVLVIVSIISFRASISKNMRVMEDRFVKNLNQRENERRGKNDELVHDIHRAIVRVGYGCPFVGEKLITSDLRKRYGVNLVSILRGEKFIPIPGGEERLFPGDLIGVVGTEEQIGKMLPIIEQGDSTPTAKKDMEVKLLHFEISDKSPLIGKTTATAQLRNKYSALLVAILRRGEYIKPDGKVAFEPHDTLWLYGDQKILEPLKG